MLRNNTKESLQKRKELEDLQGLLQRTSTPSLCRVIVVAIKAKEADLVEYKAPEVEYA